MAVLWLFTWLPGALTGLLAVWWLQRITDRHHDDRRLFSMSSVVYLRRIGATLLIGPVAVTVLGMAAKAVASYLLVTNSYPIQPVPALSRLVLFVLAGLAALAVAEVIRRGLAIREDLESTV